MITLFKTERGVRMEYDVIDGIPIMKEKYNNPFDNLYQMVYYCFSLSDLHDTNALMVLANFPDNIATGTYPLLSAFDVNTRNTFLAKQYFNSLEVSADDSWMDFDEKKLLSLLQDPFFQEYNATIRNTIVNNKKIRKYPFLEIYTLLKLESIAICNLPCNRTADFWYEWCYLDHIDNYLWRFKWFGIISDVYAIRGKNWFYDTNKFYPTLGFDPCMFKWACYGIFSCKKADKLSSDLLKKDLIDLYSELLIQSARCDAIDKNSDYLEFIQDKINNYDTENLKKLNEEVKLLKHRNQQLQNNNKILKNTQSILMKEIHKLVSDPSRTEDEKADAIAKKIYAMMPDEVFDNNKSSYNFSDIWDRFSSETRADINRSIRFFTEMDSIDIALFLMIRNVEREMAHHFFEPYQSSNIFNKVKGTLCTKKKYLKTHEALSNNMNHPTMGNIPFIGRALQETAALEASPVINAFSKFLKNSRIPFCEICKSIDTYRVGVNKNKIVEIRNIFAHGNDDKNNTYDKSSYMDVSKFLYEPPIRILFRIIIYSKLKS